MIRDNALAIAGLLSLKQGGAPIHPYQPDGLWVKVGGQRYEYEVSPGEEKYRRGLYVVWKRGAPYPSFINFDANARMACRVKRPRSNTPLQALTLLNDPVYVECAQALAARMLEQGGATGEERAAYGIRATLAREPRGGEALKLASLAEKELTRYQDDQSSATNLVRFTRASGDKFRPADLASWTVVANVLLNLDEFVMKQ